MGPIFTNLNKIISCIFKNGLDICAGEVIEVTAWRSDKPWGQKFKKFSGIKYLNDVDNIFPSKRFLGVDRLKQYR